MRLCDLALITVLAATPLHSPAFAEKPQGKKAERMICRSIPLTGTRFEGRACRTEAQWRELEEKSRQAFGEMQAPHIQCTKPDGNTCD